MPRKAAPAVPLTIHQRRLVAENMGLVGAFARKPRYRSMTMDEIISAGTVGLCRAAQLFDRSLGIRFSTYAWYWISQSINRDLERRRLIAIPWHRREIYGKEWDEGRRRKLFSLSACQEDFDVVDPASKVRAQDTSSERLEALKAAIETLDYKQKAVIRGDMLGLSDREIAEPMGLERTTIHKIRERAYSCLRYEVMKREGEA